METVEYKNLSPTVWHVEVHVKVRALWRHFHQDTNGLTYAVNSNDRNKVVDLRVELNKLIEGEMRDTVLCLPLRTPSHPPRQLVWERH